MCNKLNLKIKSVNACGVKHGFVPCGTCFACRQVTKNSWIFRLRCELSELDKKGWKIGFFTLTYSDKRLPHIPIELIKSDFRKIPCFKKDDVRTFLVKLKKWLLKKYGCRKKYEDGVLVQDTACRYMICCEYGEHTQRPHMHGIVCVPPSVDMADLHRKIKKLWYSEKSPDQMFDENGRLVVPDIGMVFPFDFNGGYDSHGYHHKPFVCNSVKAAACYAAKYVCKDIAYMDFIKDVEFYKKRHLHLRNVELKKVKTYEAYTDIFDDSINLEDCGETLVEVSTIDTSHPDSFITLKLSDYLPFHFQSKSLGLCFLGSLTDSQKMSYLKHGFAFEGEDHLQGLPVYFKNKIIFDPYYIVDKDGKRLVRRKAKKFFIDHLDDIFECKKKSIAEKIDSMKSLDFWRSLGADSEDLRFVEKFISFRTSDTSALASDYLAFYGVPYSFCYNIARPLQWFTRYDDEKNPYVIIENSIRPISRSYYDWLHYVFSSFFKLWNKYEIKLLDRKMCDSREVARIDDFWRSQT